MATYDAVKWHVLTRQKVALNVAVIHFYAIMDWLRKKDLLTEKGKNAKIDLQFELDSSMVTPLGDEILSRVYNIWAQQIDYKTKPKPYVLDKTYNLLKNNNASEKTSDIIQQQNIVAKSVTPQNNKTSTLELEVYDKLLQLFKELEYFKS